MADCKDVQKRGAACLKAVSDLDQTFKHPQPGTHLSPDEVSYFRFLFNVILWFIAYGTVFNLATLFVCLFCLAATIEKGCLEIQRLRIYSQILVKEPQEETL